MAAYGSSPRGRGTHPVGQETAAAEWFIPARAGNTLRGTPPLCSPSVHPRAGGEHAHAGTPSFSSTGSSPRGRGTRAQRLDRREVRRFIPARAGNTSLSSESSLRKAVHPRAGGEHTYPAPVDGWVCGSSPRGRGTPCTGARWRQRLRFIPARAGNTPRSWRSSAKRSVHPRAGGEHPPLADVIRRYIGSSPRGRGTLPIPRHTGPLERFIPARAGNTPKGNDMPITLTVHPRAGGEHLPAPVHDNPRTGSSPRGRGTLDRKRSNGAGPRFIPARGGEHIRVEFGMSSDDGSSPRGRGTHVALSYHLTTYRFIPARAGNTMSHRAGDVVVAVHPRAGGEHVQHYRDGAALCGSSPRGRGTPVAAALRALANRFIPARAGNTDRCRRSSAPPAVHPRAGGEHDVIDCPPRRRRGSSPRGRGTPVFREVLRILHRFIPARAGNTVRLTPALGYGPVHPRAGGEHGPLGGSVDPFPGSSPRGRGTQLRLRLRPWLLRFIPARAGNTARASRIRSTWTVHPRAGGEHAHLRDVGQLSVGSSPRGRGTPTYYTETRPHHRFIPARAGNTGVRLRKSIDATVHPRAGGEHLSSVNLEAVPGGSSRAGGEHLATSSYASRGSGSSPRGRGTHHSQD